MYRYLMKAIISWRKSDNDFPWVSAHVTGFNIGAPTECASNILHASDHLPPYVAMACDFLFDVMTWSYLILRAITSNP